MANPPRPAATRQNGKDDKALPGLAGELWQLVVDYVKQETIVPVRRLGRFVGFGVAGSLTLSAGLVLLVLGALRVLQTELGTAFEGTWSWVPYLIVLVVCAIAAALAARAVTAHKRRAAQKGSMAR